MKLRVRAAFAGIVLAAFTAHAEQPLRDWGGKPTPPLALHDLAGRSVDLHGLEGRVVLVNFWATWCEPCIAEMPSIARLRDRLSGKPFAVLAVNYGESRPKIESFLKKEKLDVPVLLDPDQVASDAWGAKGLPMSFLVDASGKIRYWVFGERDWTDAASMKAVDRLVSEASHARR
ncbi:MAG TPA: TlpA disulfide reductase family protein [Usitatibacter sp.]|nr:TlpA disulfide reductase family protein [Usitatibacter sp.]